MNYIGQNDWSGERTELLKRLWADGLSASQIATAIGGEISRSAVLGKAHRLKLAGRRRVAKLVEPRARSPRTPRLHHFPIQPRAGYAIPKVKDTEQRRAEALDLGAELQCEELPDLTPEQKARAKTLLDLGAYDCRWPLGRPGTPDFCFCGGTVAEGKPYCTPHWRRAHERVAKRA